ncbi:MAG: pyrroline-5-carboxylate reductase [Patescibacteria group bacterium]
MEKNNITIGFIGFGRMGAVLGGALVDSGAVRARDMVVYDQDRTKRRLLKGARWTYSAQEVVDRARTVFLCVRPLDVAEVARSITVHKDTIVISIAVGVRLSLLRRWFGNNVMRVIPSYTQKVRSGVLLYYHRKVVNQQGVKNIINLLKHTGDPIFVQEKLFEAATDLSSCSPAFWAYMVEAFVREATRLGLPRTTAQRIATQSLLGTAKILVQENDLTRVIDHVATPGGITREGVNALEQDFPATVKKVFLVTEKKYSSLRKKIAQSV